MKFSPLSQVQKIVIWASLSLALLAVLYPAPALYTWTGARWERSRSYQGNRRYLWGSNYYNDERRSERPDYRRMAREATFVLLIGGGLVVVTLKGGKATK